MIYMKWEVLFFYTMGMYPLPKNASFPLKIAFYLWRCTCALGLISLSVLSLIDVAKHKDFVFIDVAINIMNAGIYWGGLTRIFYFYLFDRKAQKIVDGMNALFRHESETGMEAEETMDEGVAFTTKFSKIWSGVVFFTGIFTALLPIAFIFKMGKTIPIQAWYPYDWKKPGLYELTMLTQTMTQLFMGMGYGNALLFYVSTIHLTTGQFKILNWEIKNVIYTALIKYGVSKKKAIGFSRTFNAANAKDKMAEDIIEFNTAKTSGDYDELMTLIKSSEFRRVLRDCFVSYVTHHQDLLEFCDELNAFLSPLLLPWLSFSLFYVIFISFSMVVATEQNTIMGLAEYILTALAELLIMAYFGQSLTDESEKLRDSLYEVPWYICDKTFLSTFKFAQFRASFPVAIKAGNYFTMKLELFINICKTSASYFAVLRQVTE